MNQQLPTSSSLLPSSLFTSDPSTPSQQPPFIAPASNVNYNQLLLEQLQVLNQSVTKLSTQVAASSTITSASPSSNSSPLLFSPLATTSPTKHDFPISSELLMRAQQQQYDLQQQIQQQQLQQQNQILTLDVGGVKYKTTRETLLQRVDEEEKGNLFSSLISGNFCMLKAEDGSIFIDRDGTHFKYILNYLRAGGDFGACVFPFEDKKVIRELIIEAEYYGLNKLSKFLQSGGMIIDVVPFELGIEPNSVIFQYTNNCLTKKSSNQWYTAYVKQPVITDIPKAYNTYFLKNHFNTKQLNYFEILIVQGSYFSIGLSTIGAAGVAPPESGSVVAPGSSSSAAASSTHNGNNDNNSSTTSPREGATPVPYQQKLYIGYAPDSFGYSCQGYKTSNCISTAYGEIFKKGDTVGIWFDIGTKTLYGYKNRKSLGVMYTNIDTKDKKFLFGVSLINVGDSVALIPDATHPDLSP